MKNNILVFILLLIAISSCNWYRDCKEIPIPKEDTEWFNCYSVGDTVVLKSNLNNYDTLVVITKEIEYTPCNKFELGPNQYQSMTIVLKTMCGKVDKCRKELIEDKKHNFVMLGLSNKYEKTYRGIDVYNLRFDNSICERETPDSIIYCDNITHLKIPFFKDSIEVYKYDDKNAYSQYPYVNSKYSCSVKTFHWSKQYGLVQYITENNEIFELIKVKY